MTKPPPRGVCRITIPIFPARDVASPTTLKKADVSMPRNTAALVLQVLAAEALAAEANRLSSASVPLAPVVQADPRMSTLEAICGALGMASSSGSAAILAAFANAADAAKAAVGGALRLGPGCNAEMLLASLTQFLMITDNMPEVVKQQASTMRSKCVTLGMTESETKACIASKVDPVAFAAFKARGSR